MDVILLRLDAPLMSFGGVVVDQVGTTEVFPARSMLTGMLANALGYEHGDPEPTQRLQERLRFATRRDRRGIPLRDFHTVDLGQSFLVKTGWTTLNRIERRTGASSRTTHIRDREYIADAVYSIAFALDPADESPDLDALEEAIQAPARPLFLGRKTCLPAAPILLGRVEASGVRNALCTLSRIGDRGDFGPLGLWSPTGGGREEEGSRLIPVTDERDWTNQIHVGRRFLRHEIINPPEERDVIR